MRALLIATFFFILLISCGQGSTSVVDSEDRSKIDNLKVLSQSLKTALDSVGLIGDVHVQKLDDAFISKNFHFWGPPEVKLSDFSNLNEITCKIDSLEFVIYEVNLSDTFFNSEAVKANLSLLPEFFLITSTDQFLEQSWRGLRGGQHMITLIFNKKHAMPTGLIKRLRSILRSDANYGHGKSALIGR